jgi:nucleoid-associated protein YgaU
MHTLQAPATAPRVGLTTITVRLPLPYDIVDDPIKLSGIGTGFEGSLSAVVRDARSVIIARHHFQTGGMGIQSNFQTEVGLPAPSSSAQGYLEVFSESPRDGSPEGLVRLPIIFGRALCDPYSGYLQHIVVPGDTLVALASYFYGDATRWRQIFNANTHLLNAPNLIFPGQVLRIPMF